MESINDTLSDEEIAKIFGEEPVTEENRSKPIKNDSCKGITYTIINHTARKKLHLSFYEYCILDSIRVLGNLDKKTDGWCRASKAYLGDFIGISRTSVQRILTNIKKKEKKYGYRLLEKKTVKRTGRNAVGYLRTTEYFNRCVVIKGGYKCSHRIVSESTRSSAEMSHYNDSNNDPITDPSYSMTLSDESVTYAYLKNEPFNFKDHEISQLLEAEKNSKNSIEEVIDYIFENYKLIDEIRNIKGLVYSALVYDYDLSRSPEAFEAYFTGKYHNDR